MMEKLCFETTSNLLKTTLIHLMQENIFADFRLVGGTALSLQIGHRISVDIDLFTDVEYGLIDFDEIDTFLHQNYNYVDSHKIDVIGFGKSYFIGENEKDCVKLDVYYTDKFIQKPIFFECIRLATIEEIIAMKIDVILRGGRKKDFWDLHALIDKYTFQEMINLYHKRYPYSQDAEIIKTHFLDFQSSDNDFDPICLKQKYWELIKMDIVDFVSI